MVLVRSRSLPCSRRSGECDVSGIDTPSTVSIGSLASSSESARSAKKFQWADCDDEPLEGHVRSGNVQFDAPWLADEAVRDQRCATDPLKEGPGLGAFMCALQHFPMADTSLAAADDTRHSARAKGDKDGRSRKGGGAPEQSGVRSGSSLQGALI